jgi:hypothetical protein
VLLPARQQNHRCYNIAAAAAQAATAVFMAILQKQYYWTAEKPVPQQQCGKAAASTDAGLPHLPTA